MSDLTKSHTIVGVTKILIMKKYTTLILLFFCLTLSAQIQQTQQVVNINQNNEGAKWAAMAQAQTAYYASMENASFEIIQPVEKDLSAYTHLAIVSTNYLFGWRQKTGRKAYNYFEEELSDSPLIIVNPYRYDKKRFLKNYKFLKEEKNPNWLYIYHEVSASGPNKYRSLVVRDYQNNVIYHCKGTNVPQRDILEAILFF